MFFRIKPNVAKHILVTLLVCLFYSIRLSAQTPVAVHGQLSINGSKMYDQNGDQYQLRGMSLFWSNWMGKYWNYETIKWLRDDWHCNVVRAAMGITPNGAYMDRPDLEKEKMITVIEAAIDLGIYVIVDWHSHEAEDQTEEAKAFFSEIAQTYGNYPNILYETYNEPETGWDVIKAYHEAVIPSIRQYDPNNIIILGTPMYSQQVRVAINNPVAGDNLCYALHYYAASHDFKTDAQAVADADKSIFVSEFGTCEYTGDGYVDHAATTSWWDFLDANGMGWCNWSVADADESASIVKPGSSIYGGWSVDDDLTESGKLVRNRLRSYAQDPVPTDIAPYITANPRSKSVPDGSSTSFSIEAVGQEPMTYTWYHNGSEINGSNSSTLELNNISADQTGEYYVEITNAIGKSVSKTVTLDVRYRSPFYAEPIKLPGVVQLEDYDNDGQNIGYFDTSPGNSGAGYRENDVDIEPIQGLADQYAIGFTDPGEWLSYSVDVGWDGEYEVDIYFASEPGGGQFSIDMDGQEIVAPTDVPTSGGWFDYGRLTKTVNLTKGEHIVQFNFLVGGFNVDYIEFRSMVSPEIAPMITADPKSKSARLGKPLFLSVTATGATPMTYEWYKNDVLIEGATSADLTIETVEETDAGQYYAIVTNHLGADTSLKATVEVINSDAFGGIPTAIPGIIYCKNFDEGGNGEGYFDTTEGNEASGSANEYRDEDVDTEACEDGNSGHAVGYIEANEWLNYSVLVKYTGTYTVGIRVASASAGVPTLSVEVDGVPKLSTIAVPNTGAWDGWETIEETLELTKGAHVIKLKANQGGFNLNYVEFTATAVQEDISLANGWNLISIGVTAQDMSPAAIFADVEGCIVKSTDAFYDSSVDDQFNLLSELNCADGYLVYNGGDATTVSISGETSIQTLDISTLNSGWNMVSAGSESIKVSDLPTEVKAVKTFDGFYEQGNTFSTLSLLSAGKAYMVLIQK